MKGKFTAETPRRKHIIKMDTYRLKIRVEVEWNFEA